MFGRQKRSSQLVLLGYLALVLFVGFTHTETDPRDTKNCPACGFLRASLGTAPVLVEVPIVLQEISTVEPPAVVREIHDRVRSDVSRAPPAA